MDTTSSPNPVALPSEGPSLVQRIGPRFREWGSMARSFKTSAIALMLLGFGGFALYRLLGAGKP